MAGTVSLAERHKDFFDQVYQVVRLIPEGRVTSYGAIANYLGANRGARMVGWAMNAAHGLDDVPAHRVVNRNGLLSGRHHFSTPTMMQELLEKEGIVIEDDAIVDFGRHVWIPLEELSI